jgi:ABC-type glutathione transport system ATPase component
MPANRRGIEAGKSLHCANCGHSDKLRITQQQVTFVDLTLNEDENPRTPMIQLENITKEYDSPSAAAGTIVAAQRLNLDVPTGEIFGLVGPNGAGKTTTLKMICGLIAPTAGRVIVNGIDVRAAA